MSPAIGHENKHLYEFGAFRLDPTERVLARNGERISLAPKAFDTLLILVQHSGHVLTKDELIKTLWPDSFVEENNLTQQISQLRRALGEGVDGQNFIETLPKLGYRFLPEVREILDGEGELVVSKSTRTHIVLRQEEEEENDESATATAWTAAKLSRTWKRILASVALGVATVGGVSLYHAVRPTHSADRAASVAPIPAMIQAKPRYSIVVLGFKNLPGRTDDDWLSAALAEMLTTELSAGGQLRIAPGEKVHRIKSDLKLEGEQSLPKPTLNQIRNRVGADIIVAGSYVEIGREPDRQIRLDLQLQDSLAGETVYSTAVSGKTQELFALVSRSGSQLRSKLGVPALSDLEGAQE